MIIIKKIIGLFNYQLIDQEKQVTKKSTFFSKPINHNLIRIKLCLDSHFY